MRDGVERTLVPVALWVVPYDDDPATPAPPMLSDHRPLRARLRVGHVGGSTAAVSSESASPEG